MEFLMKVSSSLPLILVVLLSACGTFEVSIEQPTPTTTPDVIKPDPLQGTEQSTIGDTQEGDLFVEEASTGWSKTVIVSGDMNWIAVIDDGQMIVLEPRRESQIALATLDGTGKTPHKLMFPEDFQHNVDTESNLLVDDMIWIQLADTQIHEESLNTPTEGIVSIQPLESMPMRLVTKSASVFFLNNSSRSPILIDFSESPNTSPSVND
jgi:hypothetical protein